jgi:hypothetical protein
MKFSLKSKASSIRGGGFVCLRRGWGGPFGGEKVCGRVCVWRAVAERYGNGMTTGDQKRVGLLSICQSRKA